MIASIKKVYALLDLRERRRLSFLFFLMIAAAFFQVVGVASIFPFMAFASNSAAALENQYLSWVYETGGFSSPRAFLVALGIAVVVAILVSNVVLSLTLWATARVALSIRRDLAIRLLTKYISEPYQYYLNVNVSVLIKNTVAEVSRVIMGYLLPLLQALTLTVVVFFMVIVLVAANPLVAFAAIFFLGGAYALIYIGVRKRLEANGVALSEFNAQKYKLANELFNGIKEIKILGRERGFIDKLRNIEGESVHLDVFQTVAGQLPKYVLETILFGGMVLVVIILVLGGGSVEKALPLLSFYAFAGYRMLPSLQQAFFNFTRVRYAVPALDIVHEALVSDGTPIVEIKSSSESLQIKESLVYQSINYAYPNANENALHDLTIEISANNTIGFVGASGSGKSTFIDILLGLLTPNSGEMLVDGVPLDSSNMRAFQNNIGYVPQTIYLADASIKENIAFGVPEAEIDDAAVRKAAKAAMLDEFVQNDLPEQYDTVVGDKGVRLSGGQRQRIGIARALYNDPDILVLDEATNALDNLTESEVMKGIYQMAGQKTIVMIAHRLSTVEDCDQIYYMDKGRVIESGRYGELLKNSDRFRNFVNISQESTPKSDEVI